MTDPLRYTITGMPASLAKNDGNGTVEMRFSTEEGTPLWLTFPSDQIDQFAVRAQHGSLSARSLKASATGHLEIRGEAVADLEVEPAVGGSAVLVILSMPDRLLIPYSLTIAQAIRMQSLLSAAISDASTDAGQTRQ